MAVFSCIGTLQISLNNSLSTQKSLYGPTSHMDLSHLRLWG